MTSQEGAKSVLSLYIFFKFEYKKKYKLARRGFILLCRGLTPSLLLHCKTMNLNDPLTLNGLLCMCQKKLIREGKQIGIKLEIKSKIN